MYRQLPFLKAVCLDLLHLAASQAARAHGEGLDGSFDLCPNLYQVGLEYPFGLYAYVLPDTSGLLRLAFSGNIMSGHRAFSTYIAFI